jgi:hypothetical protein
VEFDPSNIDQLHLLEEICYEIDFIIESAVRAINRRYGIKATYDSQTDNWYRMTAVGFIERTIEKSGHKVVKDEATNNQVFVVLEEGMLCAIYKDKDKALAACSSEQRVETWLTI